MSGNPHDTTEKYFFFVDNKKYETEHSAITGAAIKSMVPNFDPSYAIYQEAHGNDADVLITDATTVDLRVAHGGPARFYTVPPATFGVNNGAA